MGESARKSEPGRPEPPARRLPSLSQRIAAAQAAEERADAAQHRAAILAAAQRMLRGGQIHTVTMKDIATAVGIGQGTLYRKFTSKAHLAGAVATEALRTVESEAMARADETAAGALLTWFIERLAAFVIEHAELIATSLTKENRQAGWYDETAAVSWITDTMAALFVEAGIAADTESGTERARMIVPNLLFPGDLSDRAAVAAFRRRIARLARLVSAPQE